MIEKEYLIHCSFEGIRTEIERISKIIDRSLTKLVDSRKQTIDLKLFTHQNQSQENNTGQKRGNKTDWSGSIDSNELSESKKISDTLSRPSYISQGQDSVKPSAYAKRILYEWFKQNIHNPYPSKEVQLQLACKIGVSPKVVNLLSD